MTSHSSVPTVVTIVVLVVLVTLVLAGCAATPAPPGGVLDTSDDYRALGYSNQRKVVRNAHGDVFVAYRKKFKGANATAYRIFVGKSTDNGESWVVLNNDMPIEQVGDYNQRVPAIAIDSHDTLHVTWYGNDANHTGENDRQIKYVRSTDGGATWSPWTNVAEVAGYNGQQLWQEHPAISVVGETLYIVWQGLDATSPKSSQIKLVRSDDDGATWSAWQNISATPSGHSRPSMAASVDGKRLAILAYGTIGRVQQIIWSSSDDRGATWSPWTPVAPGSDDQRHVSVASDASSHFHAVWRQGTQNGKARVVYASFDGSAWSTPVTIANDSAAFQFFPSIATAGNGTLWVVWTESTDAAGFPEDDPSGGSVVVSHKTIGDSWSAPTPLSSQSTNGIYASLPSNALDPQAIDAVWLVSDGSAGWHLRHGKLGE